MKRVLMIAFHFPPVMGSSGVQRTLRFVRNLPDFGWQPIVLSVHPRAYQGTTADQMPEIPPDIRVVRAQGWDSARLFGSGRRYPRLLARPDRWISWWLGAVPAGLHLIRKFRPDALWSTYPIATAHCIGHTLARLSGLPWLADFRDPMAQNGYPEDPVIWRSFERIERASILRARLSTFTTPGALHEYQSRYPQSSDRMILLENGYDEESFTDSSVDGQALNPGRLTILHSGIVYPSERDPTQLFAALRLLKEDHPETFCRLRIRFRAPTHGRLLKQLSVQNGVESAIELLPGVGYRDALAEMLRADGLLVLQAANCNAQIPAKFYEYLRAGRPMLVLTDPAGNTAEVSRDAGIQAIAPLDDARAIAALLKHYADQPTSGTLPIEAAVRKSSRRARTEHLASLLERATAVSRVVQPG